MEFGVWTNVEKPGFLLSEGRFKCVLKKLFRSFRYIRKLKNPVSDNLSNFQFEIKTPIKRGIDEGSKINQVTGAVL